MQYKYTKYDINILIKRKYEVRRPQEGSRESGEIELKQMGLSKLTVNCFEIKCILERYTNTFRIALKRTFLFSFIAYIFILL